MVNNGKFNAINYKDFDESMELDFSNRHMTDQLQRKVLENELITHNNRRCSGKVVLRYKD